MPKPWERYGNSTLQIGEPEINVVDWNNAPQEQEVDTVGWQPPFKYKGIDPLLGLLETADYLTAAPIRYGVSEYLKGAKQGNFGPWNFFKGAKKSYSEPMTAPTGKDIMSEAGLSTEGMADAQRRTGKLENIWLPNVSPAGAAGFVAENVLDPSNIAPIGKAMMLGASAKGFGKAGRKFSALWDKKPRFEISDANAKINIPKDFWGKKQLERGTHNLEEIIDHPELFENYPHLKDIEVTWDLGQGKSKGQYRPKGESVYNANKEQIDVSAWTESDFKENLTHEIQHAIQQKEGWAKGGSVAGMFQIMTKNKARVHFLNTELSKIAKEWDKFTSSYGTPKMGMEKQYNQLRKQFDDAMEEKLNIAQYAFSEPNDLYKRLAGEAESRDTEARMLMTEAERMRTQPLESTGLGLNDLIVQGTDGPMMSAGGKKVGKIPQTIDDLTGPQLTKISNFMRKKGFDIRGGSDAYELMMRQSDGNIADLHKNWKETIDEVLGIKKVKPIGIGAKDLNYIKKQMGTTNNWDEAGYIAQDGSLLDFSGKRDGAMGGERVMDHREIQLPESFGVSDGYSEKMIKYMDMGGIRIDNNSGLLNLHTKPTPKQKTAIADYVRRNNGEIILEIGDRAFEREYPAGTKSMKILKDVNDFLDGKDPAPLSRMSGPWDKYK